MAAVTIRVPATTANMGPGFDAFGCALQLYTDVTFEETDFGLEITGCDEEFTGPDNLAYVSYCAVLNSLSEEVRGVKIHIDSNIPICRGLGSSAAVTVATIAALHHFHGVEFNKETLAHEAHGVEEDVQGIASPLDTLISTYGGLIYLSREKRIVRFDSHLDAPFVVGFTNKYGNTAKMVKNVKTLKETYPELVDPIISTMGKIANEARVAIIKNDVERIAELMNLNQGLLDSLGVNTYELSRMIYTARDNGALASKITGSGGGGSIISLCSEETIDEVAEAINVEDKTIKVKFSKDGVLVNRRAPPLP